MKKIILALSLSFLAATMAFAQDNDDRSQVLLGRGTRISGFGGFHTEFSNMNGNFAVGSGGGGAALFNQKFFFGGYGVGISKRSHISPNNLPNQRLNFGHGGFWFGYKWKPKKLVHVLASMKAGWGTAAYSDNNLGNFNNYDSDGVYVFIPEIGFELNVTSFMRVSLVGGYRLVNDLSLTGLNSDALNSPTGRLAFNFGFFGR